MNLRIPSLAAAALLALSGSVFAAGTSAVGQSARAPSPNATNLGEEPPSSVIVVAGGLEWVWANPCSGTPSECGGGQGGVLLHSGFGYATDAQWLSSFSSAEDLVAKFGGPDSPVCAASYFSITFDHCDGYDAASGYIWHSPLAGSLEQSEHAYSETFLVRAVPEPETYALMLAGLGLVGYMARRRGSRQA